jgi:hypothetical protein
MKQQVEHQLFPSAFGKSYDLSRQEKYISCFVLIFKDSSGDLLSVFRMGATNQQTPVFDTAQKI